MRPKTLQIGSVSRATLRTEDLIPSFLWECNHLHLSRDERAKVREIERNAKAEDYYESEDADWDLNETLFAILDNHCPVGCYFGAHPGDGSDFGCWVSDDYIREFEDNANGVKVSDLSDVPKGYVGNVLHVNDHGNATLYHKTRNGRLIEIWGVV